MRNDMSSGGRVLVACEFSGIVRRAFAARGYDAWSCDLLPAEDRSNKHIVGDVRTILEDGWDMLIELNPSNYTHDDLCEANHASVEVIRGLARTLDNPGAISDLRAENARLEAELAEARKVMEPFSLAAGVMIAANWSDDDPVVIFHPGVCVNIGHFRAARDFLTRTGESK